MIKFSVAARAISIKLDGEYNLFDNIKSNLRLQSSTSAASLPRSNSSQSITEETTSNTKIETLLLQSAFKFAKEAGIQELLDQIDEARTKYLSAIFLFI